MLGPSFDLNDDSSATEEESSPALELEAEPAEEQGEFERFATQALGTDDPGKLSALKEAIMACLGTEQSGGYDKGMAKGEGEGLSLLFGGKK